MKKHLFLPLVALCLNWSAAAISADFTAIRIEAEDFTTANDRWVLTSETAIADIQPDPDPPHNNTASGKANLELLPDTRVTDADGLTNGGINGNFWGNPGSGPTIDYHVNVIEAGRYLVWVKLLSTGTEDNGFHVGINGSYPESGRRIQSCSKNFWVWTSAQRTDENHCGESKRIWLDVPAAGVNTITFHAREDGFEFDQFMLIKEVHNGTLNCYPTSQDDIRCDDINTGDFQSVTEIAVSQTIENGDYVPTPQPQLTEVEPIWLDHTTIDNSSVINRHETGSVVIGDKLYVMGGRGDRPVQVFDSSDNKWSTLAPMPLELHHFQPVALDGYIYVIGAFTCCYPAEPTISDIYRFNLQDNTWETVGSMPANRLRGSSGAVAHNNKIYLIGGNTNGHSGGAVPWFDEYDPATGQWTSLPDAPKARDHFSAAIVGNKLVAAAGRVSTAFSFGGMVEQTDTYDFNNNSWISSASIPTPRAGTMIGVSNGNLIVVGGETDTQIEAHSEVEAFNVAANTWRSLPSMNAGRHSGAGGVINDTLHVVSGNINRAGGAESDLHTTLNLSDIDNDGLFDFEDNTNNNLTQDSDRDGVPDIEEQTIGTDPLLADTDADGLSDGAELTYGTNPLEGDSDFDTLSDIDEIKTYKTNPVNADSDGDLLSDQDELQIYFTDPLLVDSDNDGLNDNIELLIFNTNPNANDSDGDGVSDDIEAGQSDQDRDGIRDATEGTGDHDADGLLNYLDLDSDNDGIADIVENGFTDEDHNGQIDNNQAATDSLLDTDDDGIPNIFDLDSDQDGISDYVESGQQGVTADGRISLQDLIDPEQNGWHNIAVAPRDTDNDTTPDYLDLDSDDDGTPDISEVGQPDNDADGRLDIIIDANLDGFDDTLATAMLAIATEADGTQKIPQAASSGGCTIGSRNDPTLPLTALLIFAISIVRNKSKKAMVI